MAATVRVGDSGAFEIRGFGLRRIKALALLAKHDELDSDDWQGEVSLHFGKGSTVLGAVHRQPTAIAIEGLAS